MLILHYMSYEDTLLYVENLQQQKGIELSILIVDNCSPNDSFDLLAQHFHSTPNVEIIQSEYNGGYAYGNNFGLKYLESKLIDFVVISNNDIEIDNPSLLFQLTTIYPKLNQVAFIAPIMTTAGHEDVKHQAWHLPTFNHSVYSSLRTFYTVASWLKWTPHYTFKKNDQNNTKVDCLSGSFFLGQKGMFYQLGLFDEQTFLYMEESILGQQVKQAQLQNYLIRSLRYEHKMGKTTRSLNSQLQLQRYWLESTIYYHRRYSNINRFHIGLLYFLLIFWMIETGLLRAIRAIVRK